jgi:hypothetical protein
MTEKHLHEAVCDYIRLQYPKTRFKTDLSGIWLGGKWSLMNHVKRTTSHKGFPDLVIYEKRGVYCGLAIELKAEGVNPYNKDGWPKAGHIMEQFDWLAHLGECGFFATFRSGFDEAKDLIDEFMNLAEGSKMQIEISE